MGSVKSAGTTTLALTLASVAAAADIPVLLVDAARDWDLVTWAGKPGRPGGVEVARAETAGQIEQIVRTGTERGALVLIDGGSRPDTLRAAARLSDTVLIPLRFSPLSSYAAAATDIYLSKDAKTGALRRQAFVATAIAQIPSRIARAVEDRLSRRATERLPTGLAQRAAFEAPFMFGGTIFTLSDEQAPGLAKAQADAVAMAAELGILAIATARLAETAARARSGADALDTIMEEAA